MANLNSWLSGAVMDALGWAIIHSLWQGLAVAALAALLMALSRRPSVRYLIGVGALALMLAAPIVTFSVLMQPQVGSVQASFLARLATDIPADTKIPGTAASLQAPMVSTPSAAPSAVDIPASDARAFVLTSPLLDVIPPMPWLVGAWLFGVALFGLRFAGGFLLLEHRRRAQSAAASPRLLALCQDVQRQLGVTAAIRYLECAWLEAPAVIGWFRPVILLPVTALTGLSEDQLRAVIAHELAHIRRLDAFVNLFQIVAETLLFYHPAMWWLNRRIRAERELCCDEIAVSLTGNRLDYARALTSMAAWKEAPVLAMAANRGPLSQRILHVLGRKPFGAAQRMTGLTGGALFLMAALAAADTLFGIAYPVPAAQAKAAVKENIASALPVAGEQVARLQAPAATIAQAEQVSQTVVEGAPAQIPNQNPGPIQVAQNSVPEQASSPAPEILPPAPMAIAVAPVQGAVTVDAVDNVIGTAPRLRPEKALDGFIIAHAKATQTIDKIARWRTGLCPITIGLPPKFNQYVTQRIIRVAMTAGAPLDPKEPCQPNVIGLATAQPQALMDLVRVKRPGLLGFHYRPRRARLAAMSLPIQAWYSTATEDARGFLYYDLPSQLFDGGFSPTDPVQGFSGWDGFRVSGNRTDDGLKSQFTTALIVVDTNKIAGQEIGPLSDYIAMLALSQGQYYETCQDIPSITNLLASNCGPEMKPMALTDIDVTYLRGLYRMNVGSSYIGQRAAIAFQMKKTLGGY